MSVLLNYITNLRLSIKQLLALSGAALLGGLVLALKIQGSRIHRLQIQLLGQKLDATEAKASATADVSRKNYNDALASYFKAGGTLLLAFSLILGSPALAEGGKPCEPCYSALRACDKLVRDQDAEIMVLNASINAWKKEAAQEDPGALQSLPWPFWTLLGAIGGATGAVIYLRR